MPLGMWHVFHRWEGSCLLGEELHKLIHLSGHVCAHWEAKTRGLPSRNGIIVCPRPCGELIRQCFCLLKRHALSEEVAHQPIDLVDGFVRYVGADECLIVDVARLFAFKHRQH